MKQTNLQIQIEGDEESSKELTTIFNQKIDDKYKQLVKDKMINKERKKQKERIKKKLTKKFHNK